MPWVFCISNSRLNEAVDKIPAIQGRASLTHSLLKSYDLSNSVAMVSSDAASEEDLRMFHSSEYISYLQSINDLESHDEGFDLEDLFGLGFDCPKFEEVYKVACEVAGASLKAASLLIKGKCSIAINWSGGWHHAQRDSASGFCYVNDVVLAIQKLRIKFNKILYIDLDVHHGDGVENAFLFTPKVLTLSLHQLEPGFFPGTGLVEDVGLGRGKFFTVNVPYKAGISDDQLYYLLEQTLEKISNVFAPDAIVCQCGADALSQDPLGNGNLSLKGYLKCVDQILSLKKPTLLLGGGGYNKVNTAKLWTAITFLVAGEKLPEEIPEHRFFPLYGPDFTLSVDSSLRRSENSEKYLQEIVRKIEGNLDNLKKE